MDAPFPSGMVEEIKAFLAQDHRRPEGQDLYEEVFRTEFFFPLQRKGELARMMQLARARSPRAVVEIGADKGGGLYHWCKCLPTVTHVAAFEIRGTPYQTLFQAAFPRLKFRWGTDSGSENQRLHLGWYVPPIDCLFIDGDKLRMEQDFDNFLPIMNPEGLVFFHDITDKEPRDAYWNVRARGYQGTIIVNREDTDLAMRRENEGLPPENSHEEWLRHWKGKSCGVGVVFLGSKEGVAHG